MSNEISSGTFTRPTAGVIEYSAKPPTLVMAETGEPSALVRAGWSFVTLEKGVPSFKAIGIRETVLTTWFGLWAIALLRFLG